MTFEEKKELAVLGAFTAIVIALLVTSCFTGAGVLVFFMVLHYL